MKSTYVKTPSRTNLVMKTPKPKAPQPPSIPSDAVNVFCRIRPMQGDTDISCVRVESPTTIVLTPPEIAINYKITCLKETQYSFKKVFGENSQQRDVYSAVAEPLVQKLIKGENGLLFTYGVTGSGKTYTMTGSHTDRGIMPRCLDVLFRTLSDLQTKACVFKPDKMNGFDVLSEADAMLERQALLHARIYGKPRRNDSDPEIASRASADVPPLCGINEDNMYAVFITYVEVYNNSVYDLLEEDTHNQRTLQTKVIREDGKHNMYVHGVNEVEVKSVEDAIRVYQVGQKRKRMGHTILNAESSRSHSIFTIRLVQAPTDPNGEYLIQDSRSIVISQLSLVDLAGSERTNRTKNQGQRLREAGKINNSLLTLRTCLELLRENQTTGSNKKVPYRDSKLTHLFKNYFDGEGQVRMIVCINPRAEDYDENSQVMKFAEITQDVQVARATPMKIDNGLTPGRRKANQIFKLAVNNLNDLGRSEVRQIDIDLGLVYNLGPNFPEVRLNTPEADIYVKELMHVLEQRMMKRKLLIEDLQAKEGNFRLHLLELEKENYTLKAENDSYKRMYDQERRRVNHLEEKILVHESSLDTLNRKLKNNEEDIKEYRRLLEMKHNQLTKTEMDKAKQKMKYQSRIAVETDKMNRQLDQKLREQENFMSEKMREKEEKLRMVKNILNDDNIMLPSELGGVSHEHLVTPSRLRNNTETQTQLTQSTRTARTMRPVPVVNVRHRRSRSTGERWLEHRAPNPVPLGTILQPYYKSRKSVTKLTDLKDITGAKTSKYCLVSQGADTDGELETKLYKGEVIPTTGGGAQVIFNDVECLKQMSPIKTPQMRKRPSNESAYPETPRNEVISRCSIGIEGHTNKKPRT